MILTALSDPALDELLRGVSRSFYLSLALLPAEVRSQLSIAYLLARGADTIADTEVVARADRLRLIAALKEALPDPHACQTVAQRVRHEIVGKSRVEKENTLLTRLGILLAQLHAFETHDRDATLRVLATLTSGMERDLARENNCTGGMAWISDMAELDEHTYLAAGCVGEYWTEIIYRAAPALQGRAKGDQLVRGMQFGKGLQYVNVIRDIPNDLRAGRCYLPKELLDVFELTPASLLDPAARLRARPALTYLADIARCHFNAGWEYVQALPESELRLRVTVLLPLWIGLETLAALRASPDPLDPNAPVKISRQRVYRALAEAVATARITPILKRLNARRVSL